MKDKLSIALRADTVDNAEVKVNKQNQAWNWLSTPVLGVKALASPEYIIY